MHPITFVKNHPVATVSLMAAGMVVGPWITNTLMRTTGVGVSLPTYGNGGG